jgi:hypothetical protein
MTEPKFLMKTSDGYIYPWTKGLAAEPGFIPCEMDGTPVGGAAGLKVPGQDIKGNPTDGYAIMNKETLVSMLKNMPVKLEEYFADLGQPVPDLEKETLPKLRKYAKEIIEGVPAPKKAKDEDVEKEPTKGASHHAHTSAPK